ncbi:MAG: DUF5103 domain-containing protein, partial [Bacteroidota bacterium]
IILIAGFLNGNWVFGQEWEKFMEQTEEKELKYEDWVYEPYIRSVVLYNTRTDENGFPSQPIIPLNGQGGLLLEFDDITDDDEDYFAKIIHCNRDWSMSGFRPIEYLNEYNEYNINEFEFSINTKVPYVHYKFRLPNLKISGNYLLIVYRGGDEEDLILTRRFIIHEDAVRVTAKADNVIGSTEALRMQQVNFSVFYGGLNLDIPGDNVTTVIRKNNRWENAITELKPLFVKQHVQELDFNFFNLENAFEGGNEFRFFDTGSRNAGLNIEDVERKEGINIISLQKDKPRADRVYNSQRVLNDVNGRFLIGNLAGSGNAEVEADYNEVEFTLAVENQYEGDVFVLGNFNDWKLKDENRLVYDQAANTYTGSLFLKQGRYDYIYAVYKARKINESILEGSFNLTENEFDIIVYYRPLAGRGDRAIGYRSLFINR